ncbi:T9SS type A sorting domain-containing protein [Flavobacteriaceae bacterium Ap0902]|nr:T9SS type A sorting domain-containing protein [Flavobacteriaceae bacterium Ap0902]
MKKKLLTMALAAGFLLPLSAQWTQVGGTVKVQPNTLKYVGGDHSVKGTSTMSNEGYVDVRGNLAVENDAKFINEFTSPTEYGQLIINDQSTATGKVIGEYKTPGVTNFAFAKIAMPYIGVTAAEIADFAQITSLEWQNHPGNGQFNRNRWKNPVFAHINEEYSADDLAADDAIAATGRYTPFTYYTLNNLTGNLTFRETNYAGTPANMPHTLPLGSFEAGDASATNYTRNIYGEQLGTYLKDTYVPVDYAQWSTAGEIAKPAGFGDNYFLFGNPYTSNVDLMSVIPTDGSVKAVFQTEGSSFDSNPNDGNSNLNISKQPVKSTYTNGGFTGDAEAFLLRPYHTFGLKTDGSIPSITLGETQKTFEIDASAPSYSARATNGTDSGFNQVKVQLLDTEENQLARTYIVASPDYEAAGAQGNEAYDTNASADVNTIYTLQENEDGNVNQELINSRVYINGINEYKYVGKPIYVVQQVATPGDFAFKFNLNDKVKNSSDKFFFEDRESGEVVEITDDFIYSFTATETSDDRFAIYWNENAKLDVNDVVDVATETIVYKDNQEFKIRFAKDWTKADIFVYNILGQLVHTKKGVNTSVDYTIPFNTSLSSAYIVKAVNENGEVITKKIIK